MPESAGFHDAFREALAGADDALQPWLAAPVGGLAGLSVYRNTVAKGAVDALAANFPTVERLVGEDWFRAAASVFAVQHPPSRPVLLAYGGDFPAWLAAFPPAQELPYLPGVAALDRLWLEAHLASDAEPLDPQALAALDAQALGRTTAVPHPSLRLAWFEDNTPSLWLANRPPAEPPESFEFTNTPEGLLLVRPEAAVAAHRLDQDAFAFLAACRRGEPLEQALSAVAPDRLAEVMQFTLENGCLCRLARIEGDSDGADQKQA